MKPTLVKILQHILLASYCLVSPLGFSSASARDLESKGSEEPAAMARIRASGELVVGMKEGDSIPFFYEGPNGIGGLDVRLARAIARELGVSCRVDTQPTFDDVIESVRAGDVDVGISKLSITPSRSATVLFTEPYAIFRHGLIVNRKSLLEATDGEGGNVVALLRAGVLRLGVVKGSYETFARDQLAGDLKLLPYDDWKQLVAGVAKDAETSSVDAAYRDEFEIQRVLSENSALALFVRPYAFTDSADRIAMAVNHRDVDLKFWLDEFLTRFIQNDPTIREVLAQRRERRRALLFKIVSIKDRSAAEREFLSNINLDYYDVDAALQLHTLAPSDSSDSSRPERSRDDKL